MMVALAALVLAMGGFAVAAIPSRDGTITACYKKKNGAARIIDGKKRCKRGERRLRWNQQGREGPAGPQGAQGPSGTPDTANFYDRAASDARFLTRGGEVRLHFSPWEFFEDPAAAALTLSRGAGPRLTAEVTAGGDYEISLPLDVPGHAFGADLALKSVEVCFETTSTSVNIDRTTVFAGSGGVSSQLVADTDNKSTPDVSGPLACYGLAPPGGPVPLAGRALWLNLDLDWNSDGPDLYLGPVTVTLAT